MGAKGSLKVTVESFETLPAGANLAKEIAFAVGQINHSISWVLGAGPGDKEVAKVFFQKLNGTGVQVLNLGNYTSPSGKTAQAMTNIRAVYVKSKATAATPAGKSGRDDSIPIFKDASDIVTPSGGALFIWEKPFGAGLPIAGATNLRIDLGAAAQDVDVIVLGY